MKLLLILLFSLIGGSLVPTDASSAYTSPSSISLTAQQWVGVVRASTAINELRARHQVFYPYFSAQTSHSSATVAYARTLHLTGSQQLMAIPEWVIQIIKTAVDQVVKVLNIAIQRLQNTKIKEMNALKVAEGIIHSKGIKKAIEIAKKGRDLYDKYYEDLKVAKNIIKTIQGIFDLATLERKFLAEFGDIIHMLNTTTFTANEIDFLTRTATAILDKATNNITDIKEMVLALSDLSMDDKDRLQLVLDTREKLHAELTHMRRLSGHVNYMAAIRGIPGASNHLKDLLHN